MPAGLDLETYARLIARHGTLAAAVEKAKQDPRFASEFRAVIGRQWSMLAYGREDDQRAANADFWQLVAAWDRIDHDGAPAVPPSLERQRSLPQDVGLFAFSSIQKAVRCFAQGDSVNTVAEKTIFSKHDAARIWRLWQGDFLKLNDRR